MKRLASQEGVQRDTEKLLGNSTSFVNDIQLAMKIKRCGNKMPQIIKNMKIFVKFRT